MGVVLSQRRKELGGFVIIQESAVLRLGWGGGGGGAFRSQMYFEGSPQDLLSVWDRVVKERRINGGFLYKMALKQLFC